MDGARVKTGISGFDPLVGGGFPENSNVLLVGTPGTGKSIFALEYAYRGAEMNEPTLYVSLEESADELRDQCRQFGWDVDKMEQTSKLRFLTIPTAKTRVKLFEEIEGQAKRILAKRLVFDSVSVLAVNAHTYSLPLDETMNEAYDEQFGKGGSGEDTAMFMFADKEPLENFTKRFIYMFMNRIKKLGTTNVIIADSPQEGPYLTRDEVSEFVSDGVIALHAIPGEEAFNTLNVVKMRWTKPKRGIYNFEFTPNGISVTT